MRKERFNSDWKVWKDLDPFELVFHVPEEAETVELPYDAMFHEEQRPDSVNGGSTGFLDGGAYKYWKRFFVPEEWKGGHVCFLFEGVYCRASVFINQSLAGQQASGYSEFLVEAQDYLRFGEWNEILVNVKCGTRNSRWYSGAGIYRNVWIGYAPAVCLEPGSLRVTTMEVSGEGVGVCVEARLRNDGVGACETVFSIRAEDSDGALLSAYTCPVRIPGRQTVEFRKNLFLEHARLWSDEAPNLCRFCVRVKAEDGTSDEKNVTTGLRQLRLDSRHGLRVNGREVKLRGACIHHDQSILGAAANEAYEYRRVRLLKEAGFNAVRSAHNHASQALLNVCDRLGVYVMDELTDVWNKSKTGYDSSLDFAQNWRRDVHAMVTADYNHPSVILYSTGNEIFEISTDRGIETSRDLGAEFHRLDPTRYTTNGINGAFAAGDGLAQIVRDLTGKDAGKGDVNLFMSMMETKMPQIVSHPVIGDLLEKLDPTMDILGYNYMTARYEPDAETYPDRIMVGTETYPKQIAENWQVIRKTPAVIGDFTWTGWDYLGEVAPVYPALCNTGGDISATGVRRPVSYYREIVFGRKKGPCIAVQDPERYGTERNFGPWCFTDCTFNYTYEGMEGRPVMIQVYAGGDHVELFRNGTSLGVRPCGPQTSYVTQFDMEYEPGELMAVAYEDGREVGRCILRSAGPACRLQARAKEETEDPRWIFVDLYLQDSQGTTVMEDREVSVQISGPARLEAFGSELAKHHGGYEKPVTTMTDGHALAVLKMTGEGEIRLSFASEGVDGAEVVWK